jgi:hypothetical protein
MANPLPMLFLDIHCCWKRNQYHLTRELAGKAVDIFRGAVRTEQPGGQETQGQ